MSMEAFNRAAERQEGSSGIGFLEAIISERPDIKEKPAVFPSQGQKGHTVLIGDEVFKGPRRPDGEYLEDFKTECDTLGALAGKAFTAAVPHITTLGRKYLYLGMTRVPGEVMGGSFSSRLTEDEQKQLAKDLVNFVVEFAHALPAQGGKFAVHDDLWYNNIFIDPQTKRLSGVIDFGKVAYKSAQEWKPMFDFEGTAFYSMLEKEFDRRRGDLPNTATPPVPAPSSPGVR